MKGKWAFTVVELMVVICVIAVLISLLLPALSRARAKGQLVYCLNNLRQWGVGMHLYALDNDDFLPPEGYANPTPVHTNTGWYVQLPAQMSLPPYHSMAWHTNAAVDPGRSIWICPSNSRRSNGKNLFHYCLNDHIDGKASSDHTIRLGSIRRPTAVVYLFDNKNLPAIGAWNYVHTNLHNDGAQFLFLDGHAMRYKNSIYWDFKNAMARTNVPELVWRP